MFTFRQTKRPVARVVGGKRDGELIYLTDDEHTPNELQCDHCGKIIARKATLQQHLKGTACKRTLIYDLKGGGVGAEGRADITFDHLSLDDGGVFQVMPGFSGEREVLYTAAPSGSGKSYWVSKYLEQIHKQSSKPIFLFSGITDDPAFDKIPGLKQVHFDSEFINNPIDIKELRDSCCVFDDIGKLKEPYKSVCKQLQDELLEKGRHFKADVLSTNHLSTNGAETRNLINESNHIIVFPKASSLTETERILNKYIGFPKKFISKLQQLPGRSVYVHKNYPQFIVSDKKLAKPDQGLI